MSDLRDTLRALESINKRLDAIVEDMHLDQEASVETSRSFAKMTTSMGEMHSKLDFVIERVDSWMDATGATIGLLRREVKDLKAEVDGR
jgi:polyhydroxyalkanoate synthesis regulator phasin